ncbi:MAG TPA: hypothetical protein VJT54_13185 [Verrucomicrobiae bacterium]|nr:hypothetical protein [Verrucomicrobiae bacterium]
MMHVKVPVKIVCSCGQKYAFDVYPLNGCMPSPIKCPVCGMDGTAVANEIIAIALKAQPSPLILRPRSLTQPSSPAEVTPVGAEVETWRKRAFDAERRADQAQAAARASLAPHLAQMLKETVVQELALQRRELLKAQEEAALEIAAMIHRFDSVQAPLQDRLRSYEARIQELEKELSVLNEENRELLKLKIEMIRHQLEVERVHNRIAFTAN